jgi:hypothetical protein
VQERNAMNAGAILSVLFAVLTVFLSIIWAYYPSSCQELLHQHVCSNEPLQRLRIPLFTNLQPLKSLCDVVRLDFLHCLVDPLCERFVSLPNQQD